MLSTLGVALCAFSLVLACPDHSPQSNRPFSRRADGEQDWAYEASFNWGRINENYGLCQNGTMQSPIPLLLTQGLSLNHRPTFDFSDSVNGTFRNWGYGPGFNVHVASDNHTMSAPSVTFEENADDTQSGAVISHNETAYLAGWHIHSPADHTVQGDRSKAELHLVFTRPDGHERAVFAIRIDPGNSASSFFEQLPTPMISFRDATTEMPNISMNMAMILQEINDFNEFWTYRGSLTSPPCAEGIRWYMARNIMFVSNEQMQAILAVSTYSARAEQEVWLHAINV